MAEIRLARGQVAIVDDEACEALSGHRWYLGTGGYAVASHGGRVLIMHRVVMAAADGQIVDHHNGDKLDNRLENLRLCTHAENMRNRKIHKNNQCGSKGVYIDGSRKTPRYRAQIRVDGKTIRLGSFPSIREAELAYRVASVKYHGNFGRA